MSADTSFSLETLKELDPERYLACLYLGEDIRDDIATLWAFDAEIARIPSIVSEPLPGEIRLQWWRDLLKSGDNTGSGPLAKALIDVINRHELPRETFHTYLEARIFDLYQDPMPDDGTFEGYLGETVSVLFQNAARCAGGEHSTLLADACGHAGMAVGISRLIANIPLSRARQQLYFPVSMLEKHGLTRKTWLDEEIYEEHLAILDDICQLAQYHLTFARSLVGQLPGAAKPTFLTLSLVEPIIKRAQKHRLGAFRERIALSPLQRQWSLLRASMRKVP